MPLNDTLVRAAKPRESSWKLADEKGLFLLVTPSGGKLWRLKYRVAGKEKKLALGGYPEVWLIDVIYHILYGGGDDLLPERLWDAVADPKWKLGCMGISAYGELVGWAMPDKFPPRNGRTSKALRSLGYDVAIHVS